MSETTCLGGLIPRTLQHHVHGVICRKGFGHVVQVNHQLISILDGSSSVEINLDNATLRVTLDVIGRVGFGKDFGATRDLSSGKANLAFDMMEAGIQVHHSP